MVTTRLVNPAHNETIQAIATELLDALDRTVLLTPITERVLGFDLATAYAVGAEISRRRRTRGERTIGRKLGFTNRATWTALGVDAPFWAHVYDHTVTIFDTSPSSVSIGHFAQPQLEPELVLHFGSAPDAAAEEAQIIEHVDWIALGYEIVQCHFPNWSFQTADAISDFGLHGAFVVGPPFPVNELADPVATLGSFTIALARNGAVQAHGGGANVLGNPLRALTEVVAATSDLPGFEPIRAGEIVTTGTLTTLHNIRIGETWSIEPGGIGLDGFQVEISE
jgi:2-oxo-3-hexenedioate decarboxylase